MRRMSQEKQMTRRVWGLTDRRPCGSADREDEKTIRNVWVMGRMTKKIRENHYKLYRYDGYQCGS